MITKNCKMCGKEFKAKRKTQVFCSLKCKNSFSRKKNNIVLHNDYAELIIKTKNKELKVKISKEDVDKIKDIKWFARYDRYNYYFDGWNRETKKIEKLHRYIMDCPDGYVVDHINTYDHLDNRRENLKICTQYENMQNQKTRKNSSGYKYIIWHKQSQKWDFSVKENKIRKSIARRKNLKEIIEIRDNYFRNKEQNCETID